MNFLNLDNKKIKFWKVIDEKEGQYFDFPHWIDQDLKNAINKLGITKLYKHQSIAIELVHRKDNVLLTTPTSSGKTLVYNIPVLNSILRNKETRALYIFPLKALQQDQLEKLREIDENLPYNKGFSFEVYDGDTDDSKKRFIRHNLPNIIITNPNELHCAILRYREKWEKFFKNLKYVIVDESHIYRGIFGTHFTMVMRRLLRICDLYNSNPQFISSSATIGNPESFIDNLIPGRYFKVITESHHPSSKKNFIYWTPTISDINELLKNQDIEQRSINTEAVELLKLGIKSNLKTIAFTRARKITELLYMWSDNDIKKVVKPYKAGLLPEERREIEKKIRTGKLKGIISTNALELGIDIGNLDFCIMVGYPGSLISTWQQAGRVGRRDKESFVVILFDGSSPMDSYFLDNPNYLFENKFEEAIIDINNRYVLMNHLLCASIEFPLQKDNEKYFPVYAKKIMEELESEGRLARNYRGDLISHQDLHRKVTLRGSRQQYTIINKNKKEVIGDISIFNIYNECHSGAIYLHGGREFIVTEIDDYGKDIYVKPCFVDYYTEPYSLKDIRVIKVLDEKTFNSFKLKFGIVEVNEQVIGYYKIKKSTREKMSSLIDVDCPMVKLITKSCWIELPDVVSSTFCPKNNIDKETLYGGGLHAIEHGIISLFPIKVLCDRWDIGGYSMLFHPQTKRASIFIYDGYDGGIGLCEKAYNIFDELLGFTNELISKCKCNKDNGCPKCIMSPKCGNDNEPLSKATAIEILKYMRGYLKVEDIKVEPQLVTKLIDEDTKIQQNIIFFDVETQKGADEVGGWRNIDKMKVAIAVTLDNNDNYQVYTENEVQALIESLYKADLVIGYNIKYFDFRVLSGYENFNQNLIKPLDLLEHIRNRLNFRLKLGDLAQINFNENKIADGLQSLKWFKEGKIDKVTEYCKHDVRLIKKLYEKGKKDGELDYFNKLHNEVLKIKVNW